MMTDKQKLKALSTLEEVKRLAGGLAPGQYRSIYNKCNLVKCLLKK